MSDSVFVVDTGIVTALGTTPDEHWDALLKGETGIAPLPQSLSGQYLTDVGAAVTSETLALFQNKVSLKPQSKAYLLALWAGQQALNHHHDHLGETALILSTTKADFESFENTLDLKNPVHPNGFNPAVMAKDLAEALGIGQSAFAVSNACASGLIALIQGARWLQRKKVKHVLVLGVDILSDFIFKGFSCLQALSPCAARPFDQERNGLSLGEGAGAILLSCSDDLSHKPIASIRGWGITNDAEHITAPSQGGKGLQRCIAGALRMAQMSPEAIGFINAHGTGTIFNDEMESQAIHALFKDASSPLLSSFKGSIGHTLGAAGVIETVLSLLVLKHKVVPPSAGYAHSGVTYALNIPTIPTACPHLDTILCMKSGFGGINATVLLAEEN